MGHVPHLLLEGPWQGDSLAVTDSQKRHIETVLRLQMGDPVTYTDGVGGFGSGRYEGRVIRGEESTIERPSRLVVAVAPPASRERARFLVEKLAELGVERLDWLTTRYGEDKLPKEEKTRAWVVSALEQSRGAWLMETGSGLRSWHDLERPLVVCVSGAGDSASRVRTVAIGPEGGWADDEVPADASMIGLGPTVLRVETAALVAVARLV